MMTKVKQTLMSKITKKDTGEFVIVTHPSSPDRLISHTEERKVVFVVAWKPSIWDEKKFPSWTFDKKRRQQRHINRTAGRVRVWCMKRVLEKSRSVRGANGYDEREKYIQQRGRDKVTITLGKEMRSVTFDLR
jgi:hypothetical protein